MPLRHATPRAAAACRHIRCRRHAVYADEPFSPDMPLMFYAFSHWLPAPPFRYGTPAALRRDATARRHHFT
jgi:hypothetical protein